MRTTTPAGGPIRTRASGQLNNAGFTLAEVLVAVTILSVVLMSVTALVLSIQRGFASQREVVRAQEELRAAQMIVATVLRSAGADPNSTGQTLLDPDPMNHARFDNLRVVSDVNPADGDVSDMLEDVLIELVDDTLFVRWQAGAARQPLASPVRDILFEYYATDGTQLMTRSQVAGATRVKFMIEVPPGPRDVTPERIESLWIYLRNRT